MIPSKHPTIPHYKKTFTEFHSLVIKSLTGAWAYSTFGFIAAALMPIPWIILFYGNRLRCKSPYNVAMSRSPSRMFLGTDEEMQLEQTRVLELN